jgi:hypothetical protein
MTTKAQLTQLAERVMALTGPDREVDGLIFKALNPDRDWFKFSDCWCARCPDDAAAFDTPEHFTASLDAAMSLAADPCLDRIGGALGVLRWAMDMLAKAGASADALPRYLTTAAILARLTALLDGTDAGEG